MNDFNAIISHFNKNNKIKVTYNVFKAIYLISI